MSHEKSKCAACGKVYSSRQGLGMHWAHERRKPDGGCTGPRQRDATVDEVTAIVRKADREFETAGGSSRHYVRECLIPFLEDAGMKVIVVARKKDEVTP